MKKYLIASLFSVFVLFGFSSSAFAEMTFSPASPQVSGIKPTIFCPTGHTWYVITPNTPTSVSAIGVCYPTDVGYSSLAQNDYDGLGTYIYLETSDAEMNYGYVTPASVRESPTFVSETTYTWVSAPTPVLGCMDDTATNYNSNATEDNGSCTYGGEIVISGGLKFFPDDLITGKSTASDLTAQAGDAVTTTTKGLLPIVGVVGGIILAFVGIRFIVSALKATGDDKNKKTRV